MKDLLMIKTKEILLICFASIIIGLLIGYSAGYVRGIFFQKDKSCKQIAHRAQQVREKYTEVMIYPVKLKEGAIFGVLNIQFLLCPE